MQIPFPQQMMWRQVMTSPDHYVTAVQNPSNVVIPQQMSPEGLFRVPLVVKDGWVMQGLPQHDPHAYMPQPPMHYVTIQPTVALDGGRLNMADVNKALPVRPILVPRRPSTGTPNPCMRTLRGNTVATRRPSEEFTSGTPIKKPSIREEVRGCSNVINKEALDARIRDAILETVEYYFSDDSLSKNAYLLKQISQNESGFVNLKRISALKRLKSLTKDDRVVAQCVNRSTKLELSEDGTMIRRKEPLPTNMEPPRFIRTVIAINLPMETPTIESVTSLFVSYGDLTQVRVLKPGKKMPAYLKDYHAWIPDLGRNYCALVEFESQDEAQRACREINMMNRTSDSLRVALLKPGARLRRTLYRKYKGQDEPSSQHLSLQDFCDVNTNSDQSRDYDASGSGSGSDSETICLYPVKCPLGNRQKHSVSDSGYSHSSGDETQPSNISATKQTSIRSGSKRSSRTPMLRKSSESSDTGSNFTVRKGRLPPGIIRSPIGPKDNTIKGFAPGFRRNL